jgi:voltage-gated potassium channel
MRYTTNRLGFALGMIAVVSLFGTMAYWRFGLSLLGALDQTVTTITTVGFSELKGFGNGEKIFTIILTIFTIFTIITVILTIVGVSTVLYLSTLVIQLVVKAQLIELRWRRRMIRQINKVIGHTIVCGSGRVGAAAAHDLGLEGHDVIIGDATRDEILKAAGIERASALITVLHGDAENLFVTLSGRDLVPDPFIDVVTDERLVEFRMREFVITDVSPIAGETLRAANLRVDSGVLDVALRSPGDNFTTNPTGDHRLEPGHEIVAVGTDDDFHRLQNLAQSNS